MNLERDKNITVKNCTLIGHQYCMLDMHFCYKKKSKRKTWSIIHLKLTLPCIWMHWWWLAMNWDHLTMLIRREDFIWLLGLVLDFWDGFSYPQEVPRIIEQRMTLTSCSSRPCCLSARMTSVCCCAWPAGRSFFYFLLYLFVVSLFYDVSDFCLPYPNAVKQEICLRAGICKYLTNEL